MIHDLGVPLWKRIDGSYGKTKYQCSFCLYSTSNKFDMKKHMPVHTGERPFECNVCGKRFSRKDTLKSHMIGKH